MMVREEREAGRSPALAEPQGLATVSWRANVTANNKQAPTDVS